MVNLFISYDADAAGRKIGQARMNDSPEELARVSNTIDQGNEIFKAFALDHGGSQISAGGDEGILSVPPAALADLQAVKQKYEEALQLTVSIGIGMKMSEAFKALLASKLRGKNRTTFYDKEVEEEVKAANEAPEDDEKHKIATEYLAKRQPIHHTGKAGKQINLTIQENSASPGIQAQEVLKDFQPSEASPNYEASFRHIAKQHEVKENSQKAASGQDVAKIKQKVAQSLQAIHKQLPVLAQIKQASPDTYAAVLGVVQGLIAVGRQLSSNEQQLAKATSDLMPGGLADALSPEMFDQEQLAIGTQRELEHTEDEILAREIAMDHLTEDPDYYKEPPVEGKQDPLVKENLKEELDPSAPVKDSKVLGKESLSKGVL